jgi:hypothetical protein
MTQQDKEQLKLEIDHIFESGANKIRIFEMVANFIDSRNGVNKNFVLADVSSLLKAEREATKEEIREWLRCEDFEGLAERI